MQWALVSSMLMHESRVEGNMNLLGSLLKRLTKGTGEAPGRLDQRVMHGIQVVAGHTLLQ